MALTPEDKKDVKTHLGKALANKVAKVTRDKPYKTALGAVKSKRPNAMNMNFTESDIRGQKEVSDTNKRYAAKSKALQGRGGFDYDGMMKDVRKSFPGVKINGKSPYTDKHK